MVKALTAVKLKSIFRSSFLSLILSVVFLPSTALAVPYGSGSYDACVYEDGCPVVTTGSTTATTTTTGSSSGEDETSPIAVLNTFEDFFSATGKDVAGLVVGDFVELCIGKTTIFQACDSTNDSFYTVTVKSIDLSTDTVVVTIASTDYTLTLDTPLKIDIDSDGTDDIEVTLTDLTATTADINFRSLESSTPTVEEVSGTDETDDSAGPTETSNLSWLWWSFGGVSFLGLLAFIIAIIMKKRGGGAGGAGYGSGPMGDSSAGGGGGGSTTSNATVTSFAPSTFIPTEVSQNTFSNPSSAIVDSSQPPNF